MKVIPNMEAEFEEICAEYTANEDPSGKDIVTLTKMFGDLGDGYSGPNAPLRELWDNFLEDHQHQMTVKMAGMIIYLLLTYWEKGQSLWVVLPTLERMTLRDTFHEISDVIEQRSAANGNPVVGD